MTDLDLSPLRSAIDAFIPQGRAGLLPALTRFDFDSRVPSMTAFACRWLAAGRRWGYRVNKKEQLSV